MEFQTIYPPGCVSVCICLSSVRVCPSSICRLCLSVSICCLSMSVVCACSDLLPVRVCRLSMSLLSVRVCRLSVSLSVVRLSSLYVSVVRLCLYVVCLCMPSVCVYRLLYMSVSFRSPSVAVCMSYRLSVSSIPLLSMFNKAPRRDSTSAWQCMKRAFKAPNQSGKQPTSHTINTHTHTQQQQQQQ